MAGFNRFKLTTLNAWGGLSFLSGIAMLAALSALVTLPSLRGAYVVTFLAYFVIAGGAYILVVLRLDRDRLPLRLIWGFAILFRLVLLFTTPTLSDDVYRFIWDGHLLNQGVNPYSFPVNSPALDQYSTALRQLVNHGWMASPYLPTSQLVFTLVHQIAPESVKAFQVAAALLDLLTGWFVMDILRRSSLSARRVLIYLWNPLVIIEFAHAAHVVDTLMIFLVVLTFWLLIRPNPERQKQGWNITGSVLSLATATLTKGLPILLVSVVWRRWGWKRWFLFAVLIIGVVALFSVGAGWGISGVQDGRGVFGASRIYISWWNYNSGIYHWLEVGLSGYQTPGAVPVEIAGEEPIQLAKSITTALLALVVAGTGWLSWRLDDPQTADHNTRTFNLLRLATLPIGAYLLFTNTLHPWYVTLIIPFLPFLLPRKNETPLVQRFIWPWIYFSIAVGLSYLTYINPNDLREFYLVRQVEYIPLYLLLAWAFWPLLSYSSTNT